MLQSKIEISILKNQYDFDLIFATQLKVKLLTSLNTLLYILQFLSKTFFSKMYTFLDI